MLRRIIAASLCAGAASLTLLSTATAPASAATAAPAVAVRTVAAYHRDSHDRPARLRALSWARTQHGKPYEYGGTGPYGYDCSGLVEQAYAHAGITLPRTTYEMLNSWHLVPVRHPKRGDLAFYGPGHVELFLRGGWVYGVTFGAHDGGTVVGRIHYNRNWGFAPTMFFRVRT